MIFGIFWLVCFLLRKDLRREMLTVGLCIGVLAPLWAPWFFSDYWYPTYASLYGLEDSLYGFFAGGIVSAIYEEVYGKRFSKRKDHHHAWWAFLSAFFLVAALTFWALLSVGCNSIYAALGAYAAFTVGLCWFRRDLLQDALVSGVLFTLVTLLFFLLFLQLYPGVIDAWWKTESLSGIFVFDIPLEELLWAFGMGMAGGPLYEFVSGRRLVRRK